MAASDKDVHQKAKAIQFCIATGLIPFYEVNVSNVKELADTPELLTDIDVLGVGFDRNGVSRTIFDCKTNGKTSPINRAFWAAGLMAYIQANEAYVILKKAASEGHKLSARSLQVRLFDEQLFESHAAALTWAYHETCQYASDIDRWHKLHDALRINPQIAKLGDHLRHFVPVETDFAKTLRGIVAYVKQVRGELDPARRDHMAIFTYSVFALSFSLGPIVRDFFDVFDPKQSKETFERLLRTYVWGGRDAYQLRRKLRQLIAAQNEHIASETELSAWDEFVEMARAFLDAPEELHNCCNPMIGMALRYVGGPSDAPDLALARNLLKSNRIRQFCFRLSSYLVSAAGLPKEFDRSLRADINAVVEKVSS
jgi:hypothetical protein